MKKTAYLILVTLTSVVCTGCGSRVAFQNNLISHNLNQYSSKVERVEVNIISDNKVIKKSPTGFRGSMTSLEIEVGEINKHIAKEFFSQYFSRVNIVEQVTSKDITVKTFVTDYTYAYGVSDSTEMTIDLYVEMYINGKEKLTKKYSITDNNKVLLTFSSFSLKEGAIELFHKELLKLYNTEIKKDLLKVIHENY
ncbi:MAG TPA: hypothetical protein EYH42_00615 [Sulfurovum sp.]|nr:hypothetical protein [Sulfurovum sp.]